MILSKPDGLDGSLDISFCLSTLPPCALGPFCCILHMSIVLGKSPCDVNVFDISRVLGYIG